MSGRVFDDDETGSANLNRNLLSSARDVGVAKVHVVAKRCESAVKLRPLPSRFTEESRITGALAPRFWVGVYDIPSRWTVQEADSYMAGYQRHKQIQCVFIRQKPGLT